MSSNTTAPYALLAGENPVFLAYVTWACILGIKMLLMSPLTGTFRVKNAAFANPEDLPKQTTELKTDEQVERVRRAHLNDMENILPFLTIGLIYVLTNPNPMIAIILFRVAGTVRIIHTIIYAIYPIRQPARAICFFTCFFITIYMAVMCIIRFWFI
ncbi:microsomal glutathione S-transferase 1-like [Phlebotomus argentipes]|uniref:microsomal glutathione S-transferase 1-like n=1 Tax=Phlebotomus argentipes TaxID=94469 RepID=UPI002892D9A0|nr:microsomal glutathione S-transferase 1-like [Phlebotomus argentipes]